MEQLTRSVGPGEGQGKQAHQLSQAVGSCAIPKRALEVEPCPAACPNAVRDRAISRAGFDEVVTRNDERRFAVGEDGQRGMAHRPRAVTVSGGAGHDPAPALQTLFIVIPYNFHNI